MIGTAHPTAEIVSLEEADMRVCVPADWSDTDIERYANYVKPRAGDWKVRSERSPCKRDGQVHVMLGPAETH